MEELSTWILNSSRHFLVRSGVPLSVSVIIYFGCIVVALAIWSPTRRRDLAPDISSLSRWSRWRRRRKVSRGREMLSWWKPCWGVEELLQRLQRDQIFVAAEEWININGIRH